LFFSFSTCREEALVSLVVSAGCVCGSGVAAFGFTFSLLVLFFSLSTCREEALVSLVVAADYVCVSGVAESGVLSFVVSLAFFLFFPSSLEVILLDPFPSSKRSFLSIEKKRSFALETKRLPMGVSASRGAGDDGMMMMMHCWYGCGRSRG
jgi:hypothetical protein